MLSLYLKIESILGLFKRGRKGKEQAKWWTLFIQRSKLSKAGLRIHGGIRYISDRLLIGEKIL